MTAIRTRTRRSSGTALLALLGAFGCGGVIAAESGADAMTWLKKIAAASRQRNYSGTFVYQHGRQMESSRIAHMADANGEYEKLETLEGPPREIIRNNENVTCYVPDSKTVIIEKRALRQFPALLPEQLSGITDNYVVTKGAQDRVAGHDCQIIALEPKDNLRYGHRYCAELASGLALRSRTINEKGDLVDLFIFTQLIIGNGVTRDMLKSRFAGVSQNWHVDRAAMESGASTADSGWALRSPLAGFKKLTEMRRSVPGRATPVSHIVYSDGLAAVSVFLEPMPKSPPAAGATFQGAVNMYVKPGAEQMVTVVGEAPARTVKQIAESFVVKER
ncbi:MAG: MucB/RseB C-terminal domain-containing protein [Burkholderiales bacterium]